MKKLRVGNWCHLGLMEVLCLLGCAMASPLRSLNMMWFHFLCPSIGLHTRHNWLWKLYPPSHWWTTLKNSLLGYILTFLNLIAWKVGLFVGCEGFENPSKCEDMVVVNVISCEEGVSRIEALHYAYVGRSRCMWCCKCQYHYIVRCLDFARFPLSLTFAWVVEWAYRDG